MIKLMLMLMMIMMNDGNNYDTHDGTQCIIMMNIMMTMIIDINAE